MKQPETLQRSETRLLDGDQRQTAPPPGSYRYYMCPAKPLSPPPPAARHCPRCHQATGGVGRTWWGGARARTLLPPATDFLLPVALARRCVRGVECGGHRHTTPHHTAPRLATPRHTLQSAVMPHMNIKEHYSTALWFPRNSQTNKIRLSDAENTSISRHFTWN